MKMSKRNLQAGFTMMEIMLVVAIIVLLVGLAASKLGGSMVFARTATAKADIQTLSTRLVMYESTAGSLPSTSQGLKALVERPQSEPRPLMWRQMMDEVPKDPFRPDQPLQYVYPGVHNPKSYDLFSVGEDKLPNTADDIGNWKEQ